MRKVLHVGSPKFQCACGIIVTRPTDRAMLRAALDHLETSCSAPSDEVKRDLRAVLDRMTH